MTDSEQQIPSDYETELDTLLETDLPDELFLKHDLDPMEFCMSIAKNEHDGQILKKFKKVVERCGGSLKFNISASGPHLIKLTHSKAVVFHSNDDFFLSKYIIDCVKDTKLLNINTYRALKSKYSENIDVVDILKGILSWEDTVRMNNSSGEEVSDFSDSEDRKSDQKKRNPVIHSSGRKKQYSFSEEKDILNFIIDNDYYYKVKGNAIWRRMEQLGICSPRSWQSMKGRYLHHISRHIKMFKLDPVKEAKLLNVFNENTDTVSFKSLEVAHKARFGTPIKQRMSPRKSSKGSEEKEREDKQTERTINGHGREENEEDNRDVEKIEDRGKENDENEHDCDADKKEDKDNMEELQNGCSDEEDKREESSTEENNEEEEEIATNDREEEAASLPLESPIANEHDEEVEDTSDQLQIENGAKEDEDEERNQQEENGSDTEVDEPLFESPVNHKQDDHHDGDQALKGECTSHDADNDVINNLSDSNSSKETIIFNYKQNDSWKSIHAESSDQESDVALSDRNRKSKKRKKDISNPKCDKIDVPNGARKRKKTTDLPQANTDEEDAPKQSVAQEDPPKQYPQRQRASKKIVYEDFSSNDSEEDEMKIKKEIKLNYTEEDDIVILKYIYKNNSFNLVRGKALWESMERKQIIPGRSWHSLKERFRMRIFPRIWSYKRISKETIEKFLEKIPNKNYEFDQVSRTIHLKYTTYEDNCIIEFITKNRRYKEIKGKSMWVSMSKSRGLKSRTWMSLKNRFLKNIVHTLYQFELTDEERSSFESALKGRINKKWKFENPPVYEIKSEPVSDVECSNSVQPKEDIVNEEDTTLEMGIEKDSSESNESQSGDELNQSKSLLESNDQPTEREEESPSEETNSGSIFKQSPIKLKRKLFTRQSYLDKRFKAIPITTMAAKKRANNLKKEDALNVPPKYSWRKNDSLDLSDGRVTRAKTLRKIRLKRKS